MQLDDYLPLARKVAGWYISTNKNKADDILGQAYLGLCIAWDKFDHTSGRAFSGWAVTCMRNKITDFLTCDHTVPIPRQEYRKRYENDEFIPKLVYDQEEWIPSYYEQPDIEHNEIINYITEGDQIKRFIIEALLNQQTYRTIGDALGVSHVTVGNKVIQMRERLLRYVNTA